MTRGSFTVMPLLGRRCLIRRRPPAVCPGPRSLYVDVLEEVTRYRIDDIEDASIVYVEVICVTRRRKQKCAGGQLTSSLDIQANLVTGVCGRDVERGQTEGRCRWRS